MSAGSPRTVITSLEPEADKRTVLTEEARQIGARIDAARAHEAEESLKEHWTIPGDPANQQEKASAQAALKSQGRRGDDRESCVGISPGRTWTSMLTWFATAYYVRVQQQWDPTLGFPKPRRGTRHGQRTWSTYTKCTKRTRTRTVSDRTPNVHGRIRDQEPQPQRGNSRAELGNLARYANESSASS